MKTARLRRKLTSWERYARRNEKLGQGRLYNAHIYYIAYKVMEGVRRKKDVLVPVQAFHQLQELDVR